MMTKRNKNIRIKLSVSTINDTCLDFFPLLLKDLFFALFFAFHYHHHPKSSLAETLKSQNLWFTQQAIDFKAKEKKIRRS